MYGSPIEGVKDKEEEELNIYENGACICEISVSGRRQCWYPQHVLVVKYL